MLRIYWCISWWLYFDTVLKFEFLFWSLKIRQTNFFTFSFSYCLPSSPICLSLFISLSTHKCICIHIYSKQLNLTKYKRKSVTFTVFLLFFYDTIIFALNNRTKKSHSNYWTGLPRWLWVKNLPANAGNRGESPEGGPGNPLQYSDLENPIDRGASWAIVHRVGKNQTWLRQLSMQLLEKGVRKWICVK